MLRACGFSPSDEQVKSFLCPRENQQQVPAGSSEANLNAGEEAPAMADPTGSGKVIGGVVGGYLGSHKRKNILLKGFLFNAYTLGSLQIKHFNGHFAN